MKSNDYGSLWVVDVFKIRNDTVSSPEKKFRYKF